MKFPYSTIDWTDESNSSMHEDQQRKPEESHDEGSSKRSEEKSPAGVIMQSNQAVARA